MLTLARLGFLTVEDASKWTERLMDAAGIEWEHVDVSSSFEMELEAEEVDPGENSEGGEGEPSPPLLVSPSLARTSGRGES